MARAARALASKRAARRAKDNTYPTCCPLVRFSHIREHGIKNVIICLVLVMIEYNICVMHMIILSLT